MRNLDSSLSTWKVSESVVNDGVRRVGLIYDDGAVAA